MFSIDSIGLLPQSAVTLYIYRVGKTYPVRNPIYRSKSIKFPNCTRTPHGPVGPTGHTGRLLPDRILRADQSDRLGAPVRPVMPILAISTRPFAFLDSSYKFHYWVWSSTSIYVIKGQQERSSLSGTSMFRFSPVQKNPNSGLMAIVLFVHWSYNKIR